MDMVKAAYIHADNFSFLARTEVQTWYQIDDEHDGVGYDKRPSNSDADPGCLFAQLYPVTVTNDSRRKWVSN